MRARTWRALRVALAGAVVLTGCNALLDVKEIYHDPNASLGDGGGGDGGGGADGSNDGNVNGDGSTDGGTDGGESCTGADLQTSAKHCGRCGHDCQGGACTAGVCASVTLAGTLSQPSGIAIDATHVYVANKGDGSVIRVPKAGGAPEQLVSGQSDTRGVAVMGNTLFWSNDSGAGGLHRCTLPLCSDKQMINPTSYLRHIEAKDGYVYFASQSDVRRVLPDGGAELAVAPNVTQAFAIATDSTHVYYTSNQNDVYRNLIADGGGEEPVGPLTGSAVVGFIALDNDTFYWAYAAADGKGTVIGAKKSAVALRTTFGTANIGSVGVASDGTNVFWANDGTHVAGVPNGDGVLLTCPKQGCGGTAPVTLVDKLKFAGAIVTDATAVYFLEYGGNAAAAGTVRKIAKP